MHHKNSLLDIQKYFNINAVCFLCVKPHKIICDFANCIENKSVYILLDCNDNIENFIKEYSRIIFIQINDNECKKAGFYNANTWGIQKNPTSWDKFFYYFSTIDTSFNHVWAVEDDVFIRNECAFENIDIQYTNTDLLCATHIAENKSNNWMYWNYAENKIDKPWFHSMVCSCRISKQLFKCIKQYVDKHNTLFYIEIMINTLAAQNNLSIKCPKELSTIGPKPEKGQRYRYNNQWISKILPNQIEINYMYHPVKPLELHHSWR